MEYVYAALLLHKLGKEVNEEKLRKLVSAAEVEVDDSKIKSLITSLKGVDIEKELESASLAAAVPVSSDSASAEKKEDKKEEPEEDSKRSAAEGLSALFG